MEISFCPYRTQFSPSKVLYTAVSQPITFKGNADDLELLEAAREKEEQELEQERRELAINHGDITYSDTAPILQKNNNKKETLQNHTRRNNTLPQKPQKR